MPGLTAINNTYTANTPSGVRACLRFLQGQSQSVQDRGGDASEIYCFYPISIVYGVGVAGNNQCVAHGDDLDIVPVQGERVRKRRWWNVSRAASKQMLLPFPEHARGIITAISWYSYAVEVVIQLGLGPYNHLNLSAPRARDALGPYIIRAIRIHNVDRSETVPPMQPMQPVVDESCQLGAIAENTAVEAAPMRPINAAEPNPCRERRVPGPSRNNAPEPTWEPTWETPPTEAEAHTRAMHQAALDMRSIVGGFGGNLRNNDT